MPCFHPLDSFKGLDGLMHFRKKGELPNVFKRRVGSSYVALPCGQCIGCRLERSRQWAVRCMHEASLHRDNTYITLTYHPDNLPHAESLNYRDFQLFLKRLRKFAQVPISFYMAGEYGDNLNRPHYHAIIFGYQFKDLKYLSKTEAGATLYTSADLTNLWGLGYCSVGAVTFESAAYVARYIMKKQTKAWNLDGRYESVNKDTGEVSERIPEFNRMSLKPAIGKRWYEKYSKEVFPSDEVITRGKPAKPPKYYDKLLKSTDLEMSEIVKFYRVLDAVKQSDDATPSRLRAREICAEANLNKYQRKF